MAFINCSRTANDKHSNLIIADFIPAVAACDHSGHAFRVRAGLRAGTGPEEFAVLIDPDCGHRCSPLPVGRLLYALLLPPTAHRNGRCSGACTRE